ncbi:MAG: hypothetical protein OXC13_19420 [Caldilineaceae bacterium]|nr:hypothetical protein [Caldilineaceae bacterium]
MPNQQPGAAGWARGTESDCAAAMPPPGRARWTLKLLAAELVALEVVDAIAPETVRRALKKTR